MARALLDNARPVGHSPDGEAIFVGDSEVPPMTGEALPDAKMVRRELAGVPKIEVVGLSKEKVEETLLGRGHPGQGRPGGRTRGNSFRSFMRRVETNGDSDSTLPPWCVMMCAWIDAPYNGSATTS